MTSSSQTINVDLRVPKAQPARLDPQKSALVIVDMVNDFCAAGGAMMISPRFSATVPLIKALLDRCRKAGMPIIHVQTIRDPDAPEFTRHGQRPFALRGTWGAEISPELTPLPGEPVVEKNSHDCFNATRMEAVLASKGIRPLDWNIVVVGLGLTVCVGCTVIGFSVRHYENVLLPMDCTASGSPELEIREYQRYLQPGYSYNVTLTHSSKLTIGAEKSATAAA